MADASSSSSTAPSPPLAENWCNTELKTQKVDYVWTINKFSSCTKKLGEYLQSSTFSSDPNAEQSPKWYLDLYPKGLNEAAEGYLSLYLHCVRPTESAGTINASFKFAILNAQREHTNAKKTEHNFGRDISNWGWPKLVRHDFVLDEQNGLLPDDQLTIFCEVSIDSVNVSGPQECPVPEPRLSTDMGAVLKKGLLADCVLSSDGNREFKVHKVILASRSPVFAAMFEHDTEEKRTSRVHIPDVTAPVLGQLLYFLYTGEAPKLLADEGMAQGLLAAADKYQLDRLKALCQKRLSTGLTKENVCTVLALADRHNAEHLKARAILYINLHPDEVMESDQWAPFVASHPELLKQVIKSKTVSAPKKRKLSQPSSPAK